MTGVFSRDQAAFRSVHRSAMAQFALSRDAFESAPQSDSNSTENGSNGSDDASVGSVQAFKRLFGRNLARTQQLFKSNVDDSPDFVVEPFTFTRDASQATNCELRESVFSRQNTTLDPTSCGLDSPALLSLSSFDYTGFSSEPSTPDSDIQNNNNNEPDECDGVVETENGPVCPRKSRSNSFTEFCKLCVAKTIELFTINAEPSPLSQGPMSDAQEFAELEKLELPLPELIGTSEVLTEDHRKCVSIQMTTLLTA